MKLYCYHVGPIDLWHGDLTENELVATFLRTGEAGLEPVAWRCEATARLVALARATFKEIG